MEYMESSRLNHGEIRSLTVSTVKRVWLGSGARPYTLKVYLSPPARLHLLNLPKQHHQLRTACSNTSVYQGHFSFKLLQLIQLATEPQGYPHLHFCLFSTGAIHRHQHARLYIYGFGGLNSRLHALKSYTTN